MTFAQYQEVFYDELREMIERKNSFNSMFYNPLLHLETRLEETGFGEIHTIVYTKVNGVDLFEAYDPQAVTNFIDVYALGVVDGRNYDGPHSNYIALERSEEVV